MGPIEYDGICFDSRLEAQWAVFFDAVGITYRHKVRFVFDDDFIYEPHFWLDLFGFPMWFLTFPRLETPMLDLLSNGLNFAAHAESCDEIEPNAPSGMDCCLFAFGTPDAPDNLTGIFPVNHGGKTCPDPIISSDVPMLWAECHECGKIGLWSRGKNGELWWWRRTEKSDCCAAHMTGRGALADSPALRRAYLRATNYTGRSVPDSFF